MRNKKANLMVLSDSTGSERALQEMDFEIWQAYLVPLENDGKHV